MNSRKVKRNIRVSKINSYEGKILVMDDDYAVREALCNILKRLGLEIFPTAEGSETVEEYEKSLKSSSPYDLVVLDLTVPGGMGGKESINKLLNIDPNIKAVI